MDDLQNLVRYADKYNLWKDREKKEYSPPFLPKFKQSSSKEARYFCMENYNQVLHDIDAIQ